MSVGSLWRLVSKRVSEVRSNSGVHVPRVFLPQQFVSEFVAVVVRGGADVLPGLSEREETVSYIWREFRRSASRDGEYFISRGGVATDLK